MIVALQWILRAILGLWTFAKNFSPWIAGLISSLAVYLGSFSTRKIAITGSYLTVYFGLLLALHASLVPIMSAVITNVTPNFLLAPISWVIPTNFSVCVSTIALVRFLRYIYELKVELARRLWNNSF